MSKRTKKQKTRLWLRQFQKRQQAINNYARQWLCPVIHEDKIALYHPDEYRRWIQTGPCAECPVKAFCDTPCGSYLHWYDQRISLARQLLL